MGEGDDFGGPGDIVHPEVGYKVSLTNESDVVSQMERFLAELIHNRDLLERLRQQGIAYARECLTWEAKAQSVTRIMHWALGQGPKPDLPAPKVLAARHSVLPIGSRADVGSLASR